MRTSSLDSGSLLTSVRSVRSVESLSFHLLVGRLVKRDSSVAKAALYVRVNRLSEPSVTLGGLLVLPTWRPGVA